VRYLGRDTEVSPGVVEKNGLMQSQRLRILAYQAIERVAEDPNGTATSPERFRAQMSCLKRHNLWGISMRELRRTMAAGGDGRGWWA
jgi:hypothetical protein